MQHKDWPGIVPFVRKWCDAGVRYRGDAGSFFMGGHHIFDGHNSNVWGVMARRPRGAWNLPISVPVAGCRRARLRRCIQLL